MQLELHGRDGNIFIAGKTTVRYLGWWWNKTPLRTIFYLAAPLWHCRKKNYFKP